MREGQQQGAALVQSRFQNGGGRIHWQAMVGKMQTHACMHHRGPLKHGSRAITLVTLLVCPPLSLPLLLPQLPLPFIASVLQSVLPPPAFVPAIYPSSFLFPLLPLPHIHHFFGPFSLSLLLLCQSLGATPPHTCILCKSDKHAQENNITDIQT